MRLTLTLFIFVCLVMAKHERKHTPGGKQSGGHVEVEEGSSSDQEQTEENNGNQGKITYDDVSEGDFGEDQVTNADDAQNEDVDGEERIRSFLSNRAPENDSSSGSDTFASLEDRRNESKTSEKFFQPKLPSPGGQDEDESGASPSSNTSSDEIPEEKRCLFVGDLLNFGNIKEYKEEKNFIRTIAVKCLENEVQGTVWAYGNTTAELDVQLGKMTNDTGALWNDIEITIKYADITGNYSNENVVSRINEINDEANCLVFFSAAKNANVFGKPFKNPNFKKIVVASLQGADLSKLGGHETIIVTDYGDSNVWNIVNKIIGFTTTTSKTTMESGTTTDNTDEEMIEEETTRITSPGAGTKSHTSGKKQSTEPHPVVDDWGEPGAQKTDTIRRWSFVIAIVVVLVAIIIAYLYYFATKKRVERKRRLAAEARRKRRRIQLRTKADDRDKKDEPVFMFNTEAKIEGEKTSPNASGQKLIEVRKDAEHENDR